MPERYRIVILPEASSNLVGIFDYVEKDSPQNAAGLLGRLIDAIDSLEYFPRRHKVHRSRRDRRGTVHSMSVRPYSVYYRVLEPDRVVEVMTVRHGSRRKPKL